MTPDNEEAWRQLSDLYEPLIRRWVGRLVPQPDADDITQEVLTALVEEIPISGTTSARGRSGRG